MWFGGQGKKLFLQLLQRDPKNFLHFLHKFSPITKLFLPHLCPSSGPQYIWPEVMDVVFFELELVIAERGIEGKDGAFDRSPKGGEVLGFW